MAETVTPRTDIVMASGADAAPEIVHGGQRQRGKARGVHRGHLDPGGLLEAVTGEEHVVGELAELCPSPRAQTLLGQGGGHQVGGHARRAQARLQGEDSGLCRRAAGSAGGPARPGTPRARTCSTFTDPVPDPCVRASLPMATGDADARACRRARVGTLS